MEKQSHDTKATETKSSSKKTHDKKGATKMKAETTKSSAGKRRVTKGHAARYAVDVDAPSASQTSIAAKTIDEIRALSKGLHLRVPLSKQERKTMTGVANAAPPGLVEAMATSASVHGGSIAGLSFDATAARTTLARTASTVGVVQWARTFARTLGDDLLRDRAAVASRALAAYAMLGTYVTTPEGASMLSEYEQMQALVRGNRTSGKGKKPATKATPVTATATASATATPAPTEASAPTTATPKAT